MVSVSMTFRMKKATASEAVLAAAENILPYLLARPYLFAVAGIVVVAIIFGAVKWWTGYFFPCSCCELVLCSSSKVFAEED